MAAYRDTINLPSQPTGAMVARPLSSGATSRIRLQALNGSMYIVATATSAPPTSLAGALWLSAGYALPASYTTGDSFPDIGDVAAYWWAVSIGGADVSVSHA